MIRNMLSTERTYFNLRWKHFCNKLNLLSKEKGLPYELHDKIWEDKQNITLQMIGDLDVDERLVEVLKKLKKRVTYYVGD